MRSVFVALFVLLACTVSVSVSASSAVSPADWAAPSLADAWSSEVSVSEFKARSFEFDLMATTTADGSTGPGPLPAADTPVVITVTLDCTIEDGPRQCPFKEADLVALMREKYNFPNPNRPGESFKVIFRIIMVDDGASSSSSTAAGRRLLTLRPQTVMELIFTGSNSTTSSSSDGSIDSMVLYTVVAKSFACGTDAACADAVAASYGVPSIASSPAFLAAVSAVVPGSLVTDDAVTANTPPPANPPGSNNVQPVGGPRRTNGGFYFLGAVVLLFAVVALVYMIVHKAPKNVIVKEEIAPREEVALASVVAAPHNSGVVVAKEDAPLGAAAQQQMDYRSVFALKHNVLDNKSAEQRAAEDNEHNHNDVHFILHQ